MLNLEHLKLSNETVIILVSNGLLKQAFLFNFNIMHENTWSYVFEPG